jgi:type I restriction enzyme S subunit
MGSRWVSGEFAFVTEEKAQSLEANLARPGDVVFTQRGTLGQVSLVPNDQFDRYLVSQSQMKLTVNRDIADSNFFYYVFTSAEQKHYIHQHAIQTGVPHTNLGILRATPVPLPPLTDQRAIAHILGTLDDKIELNRQMSETLDAMARALFKSWFVDFDPVRAKMEGRDPGLPEPLADLFPDSFDDSELGEIPRGWEVKTLGDMLELAYGKALKAEDRRDGDIPVYGSNGQVGWHDKRLVAGPGIVVGRKGNPGIATWVPTDFFPIDTTFYVLPKLGRRSLEFLFHVLRTHDLPSLGADSAVPGLNRNIAYMNSQVLPPAPLLAHFERLASAFSQRVSHGNDETRTLAALRDTLLPKLISGELRLMDAKRSANAAV